MHSRALVCLIGITFFLAGTVGIPGLPADPEAPTGAGAGRTVHGDGQAMQKHLLEAVAALMRYDAGAARKAMDGLEKQCRRMLPGDSDAFGRDILSFDLAYHKALDRTREHAGAGDVDAAFDAFFWVQRSCRECHAAAREAGRLPAEGALW